MTSPGWFGRGQRCESKSLKVSKKVSGGAPNVIFVANQEQAFKMTDIFVSVLGCRDIEMYTLECVD